MRPDQVDAEAAKSAPKIGPSEHHALLLCADASLLRSRRPFHDPTYRVGDKSVAEGCVLKLVEKGLLVPTPRERILWDEVDYHRTEAGRLAVLRYEQEKREAEARRRREKSEARKALQKTTTNSGA
jgi:hypothetical protein